MKADQPAGVVSQPGALVMAMASGEVVGRHMGHHRAIERCQSTVRLFHLVV